MLKKQDIILLDPTIGSMNVGDIIIKDSIEYALRPFLMKANIRRFPTRTVPFQIYQTFADSRKKYVQSADFKFVLGTDLIKTCMFHSLTQWNINIFNCKPLKDSILIGAGIKKGRIYLDPYTRALYRKVLNSSYFHSVRDNETKKVLEDLGLKVINTGCPTLWSLGKEFCAKIPKDKANTVVFTLHHALQDRVKDQDFINTLEKNYYKVFFFPQTPYDIQYINTLDIKNVNILPSNLDCYKTLLQETELDYIGVRLHGGILAMQYGKRVILITIDNRTKVIGNENHLNILDRNNISELETMLNSSIVTDVFLDTNAIDLWLSQFK